MDKVDFENRRASALDELRKNVVGFSLQVAPIYQLLNWEWGGKGVPTPIDIRDSILSKIDDLEGHDDFEEWCCGRCEISSGGLFVALVIEGEDDQYLNAEMGFTHDVTVMENESSCGHWTSNWVGVTY